MTDKNGVFAMESRHLHQMLLGKKKVEIRKNAANLEDKKEARREAVAKGKPPAVGNNQASYHAFCQRRLVSNDAFPDSGKAVFRVGFTDTSPSFHCQVTVSECYDIEQAAEIMKPLLHQELHTWSETFTDKYLDLTAEVVWPATTASTLLMSGECSISSNWVHHSQENGKLTMCKDGHFKEVAKNQVVTKLQQGFTFHPPVRFFCIFIRQYDYF